MQRKTLLFWSGISLNFLTIDWSLYWHRWGDMDAHVICKQLYLTGGQATSEASFGTGTGPIWLDAVDCSGDEPSVGHCYHNAWGVHDCTHAEDAGVICGKITAKSGMATKVISLARATITWRLVPSCCIQSSVRDMKIFGAHMYVGVHITHRGHIWW